MPFFDWTSPQGSCRLHYEINGSGPLLILLHNGFYSVRSWDALIPELSKNFRCVAWDRQGYGRSGSLPFHETTVESGAQELDCLLAELDRQGIPTQNLHFWGHCMGAAVAVAWNAAHPGRANSIFLEACGFFSDPEIRRRTDIISRPWDKIPAGLRRTMVAMHSAERAPDIWAAIIDHTTSYIMDQDYDLRPYLSRISAPCLVANGDHDLYFSRDHARSGAACLANCQLWLPEDFGHDMHLEKPRFIQERHEEFVNSLLHF